MANGYGMRLDRDLTLELLSVAYDVARHDRDPTTSRRTLEMRLRDHVSDQEAGNKTKKCLTRVWLNPPAEAAAMIGWALDREDVLGAPAILHFGALLATYPFVGVVAKVVGSHLKTEGQVHARDVRAAVQKVVGGTATVDMAARKSYTTLAHLGLITKDGQALSPTDSLPEIPTPLAPWLIHALLLTRRSTAVDASSITTAPELLGLRVAAKLDSFPLLDVHQELSGRVFVPLA